MNPRTPRRRISPQTRRRCRAIKGFFKRALGSLSQPDLLQITSSIAVNVTDINHKIVGLEQQVSEVCRQCSERTTATTAAASARPSPQQSQGAVAAPPDPPHIQLDRKLTDVIYTKSQNKLRKSTESDYTPTTNDENNTMSAGRDNDKSLKLKKKKSKSTNRDNDPDIASAHQKPKTESTFKSFVSAYSTSSFHSLDDFRDVYYPTAGYSGSGGEKRRPKSNNERPRKTFPERYDHPREEKPEKATKKKKSKHSSVELDPDFIADIIKRQYKPVKFGRRHSDLSQFSTPVCRDYEFRRDTPEYSVPEQWAACGCGAAGRHSARAHSRYQCSDARSVCDAAHYAKRTRSKHRRRQPDMQDQSEIYDLVPVKEKTSPKSRRKFIEDSMRPAYHKEVPPSPRSHRPQLNLKARYAESDCDSITTRIGGKKVSKHAMRREAESYRKTNKRHKSPKNATQYKNNEDEEDAEIFEIHRMRRHKNVNDEQADADHDNSTVSGLYPTLVAEDPAAADTTLDKTQDTVASDKTDKALCEIKDILQSFLLEIKKEASSHTEKSTKMSESGNSPPPHDAGVMTTHGHSFTNFNSAQCSVPPSPFLPPTLPAFGNHPCCYPVMPMCPINCSACLQNSGCVPSARYPAHSASFPCNNCYDKSNDTCNTKNTHQSDAANEPLSCETDELIKQIYKFVSQSPTFLRKSPVTKGDDHPKKSSRTDVKLLTSRSVGGSTRLRRHDAKVGTTKMNCASKSCEAIGAKTSTDTESSDTSASASYSDTVLDKFSLEPTTSDTELNTPLPPHNKSRQSKFTKVLNSLGLRKKMRREAIEELSESESTIETEVKKRPPFQQQVASYAMYGQEYYRPPPVSPHYRPEYAPYEPYPGPPPGLASPYPGPPPGLASPYPGPPPGLASPHPSAPPYCGAHSYDGYGTPLQPQVPLCLKEVEVKSIGCQSERKLSFFRKMRQRQAVHTPTESSADERQRHGGTQTPAAQPPAKPALFNWKVPSKDKQKLDQFSYETQKKLALGDIKIRNAVLKKMFYKRNPFSPRNLIIKTLLGKDKSSYGDPPAVLRPKMFF